MTETTKVLGAAVLAAAVLGCWSDALVAQGGWSPDFHTPGVGGVSGRVLALAVHRAELVAGGMMTHGHGRFLSHLARYDARARLWRDLGGGVSGGGRTTAVRALAVAGNDLIVGGSFTAAGGVPASHVARWDGTRFRAMGAGLGGDVFALAVHKGRVYAAGSFATAGGGRAWGLAVWDGRR